VGDRNNAWVSAPIRFVRGHASKLVLHGVEHGGPSFEARVFLDNPHATASTPTDVTCGYAGSLHVYGRGDGKPSPTDRELDIGNALQRIAKDTVVVSVVALLSGAQGPVDLSQHLAIASVSIR
jgi:hypothetical protein